MTEQNQDVELIPDYVAMFRMYSREAENAIERLRSYMEPRVFDRGLPSEITVRAVSANYEGLQALHRFYFALNMALQTATTLQDIGKIREISAQASSMIAEETRLRSAYMDHLHEQQENGEPLTPYRRFLQMQREQ